MMLYDQENYFPKYLISFCKICKPLVHSQKLLLAKKTKLFVLTTNSLVIIMQIIYQPNRKRTLPFSRLGEKNHRPIPHNFTVETVTNLKLVQKDVNNKFKAHTLR